MAKRKQATGKGQEVSTAPIEAVEMKTNKSEKIRQALKDYPDKKPRAIAELLTGQGFSVTPGLVSMVKSKRNAKAAGGNGRKKKRSEADWPSLKPGRKPGRPAAASPAVAGNEVRNGMVTLDDVGTVRGLARKLGKDSLHKLVDAVAD